MTPDAVHIWAAGFFDGEGSVLIYRRKTPSNGVTTPYNIRATVTNTDPRPIRLLHCTYGGNVSAYRPRAPRRRAWKWTAMCRVAAKFLREVSPYLVVKREQAEIALIMQDTIERFKRRPRPGHRGQEPLPSEEVSYRDSLHTRLLELRHPSETVN